MTPRREQAQKDVIKPLNNPVVNPTNETNNVNDVVIDENSAIESENETEHIWFISFHVVLPGSLNLKWMLLLEWN
jgi:hypothetical protein